jgi:hypothetical protein
VLLWYAEPNAISNAIGYAKHRSRSHQAVIRVYDAAGDVIETHQHKGDFDRTLKTWVAVTTIAVLPSTPELRAIINLTIVYRLTR